MVKMIRKSITLMLAFCLVIALSATAFADQGAKLNNCLMQQTEAQAAGLLRRRAGRHIRGRYEKGAVFLPARQRTGGAEHHHPGDLAEDGLQGV